MKYNVEELQRLLREYGGSTWRVAQHLGISEEALCKRISRTLYVRGYTERGSRIRDGLLRSRADRDRMKELKNKEMYE